MSRPDDYLFARPSFKEGVARILDLGSTLNVYNNSKSSEEADCKALESDWWAVGNDMRNATAKFKEDLNKPKPEK
jgi:hypothetical protein